ncbi:hypothetical protein [Kitasatospora terrestris]|uniref:HNH endonuclease n=1 Tax=Kitasatospora terrestris TaxID=258051 RepID=A0ABP9E2Z5_9ACTN
MTQPAIRPHVVAQLIGLVETITTTNTGITHRDGSPLTPAEDQLLHDATPAELHAGRDYHKRAAQHLQDQVTAMTRIQAITAPYAAASPAGTPLKALLDMATPEEQVELQILMNAVAPDGTILTRKLRPDLGIGVNSAADPDGTCGLCDKPVLGEFDDDHRVVAVVINPDTPTEARICESCTEDHDPSLWHLAEGVDEILTGLLWVTADERADVAQDVADLITRIANSLQN